MSFVDPTPKRACNAAYRAIHGHSYSKEKMREYNRAYNARKKGIAPGKYRLRSEISRVERFMFKLIPEPNSGCWLWLTSVTDDGYGQFAWDGRTIPAHRASFMLFHGPIARGSQIRHLCDNPSCVNPDHLLIGTAFDNVQDRIRRGRSAKKKLTPSDVLDIRRRYALSVGITTIATAYGVAYNSIWAIVTGRAWKHIS